MQKSPTFPRFISNSPSGVDLFESRSQEKTAKSIAEHIKVGDNDYKLIGLDGEWGSGKSNAISIIQKQLGADFHLFVYDTWAHQEDLQRRSFLEELTENLQKNKVVNQLEWKSKLNNLLAKKKVTVTKTIPTLSYAIIASLIITAVMPLAKSISDTLPQGKEILKLLITSAPLIIAIIIWVISALRDKKNWNLVHLFRIYEKQDLKKVSDETISESEPSLREFRDWLSQLNQDSKMNIVIVFDNMDRLPAEKIKVIWALLHTFFSSEPYSRICVIVPFDRAHIREAFGEKEEDIDFEKTNHLINKTFSVIFNISPAVITDWKKLFEHKFNEAFGGNEKEEYIITRKVFDLYSTSITPRKIIAFINDLVSLKLIWDKEIKLRYMALFVMNRQQISENPLSQILNKGYLEKSRNLFSSDDSLADNIAALMYNVPIEKATQVTLQREIEIAIRQMKIEDLKEFSKNSDFISILEQIPTEDIEVEAMSKCLTQIDKSITEADQDAMQVIWDRVVGRQMNLQIQHIEFTEVYKTLILKARTHNKKKFVKFLLDQFYNVKDFSGSKYFAVLQNLENFLNENNIDIGYIQLIDSKAVAPDVFVDYAFEGEENYGKFKVTCDNAQLEKFYIDKLPNALDDTWILWNIKTNYSFTQFKAELENVIKKSEVTLENLDSIFDAYKAVSPALYLSTKLSDSKIYELLSAAKKDSPEYYELSAMRIARGESFTNQGGIDSAILDIIDDRFISEVSTRIQHYNYYGSLLLTATTWSKPALISIAKKLTVEGSGNSMSIEKVLPEFQNIATSLDITQDVLIDKLNPWAGYLKTKLTVDNLISIIPDSDFYKSAVKVDNELIRHILETAVRYTEQASEDDWNEAFEDSSSYLFDLLAILVSTKRINSLNDNVFAAFKNSLHSIVDTPDDYDISEEDTLSKWQLVYKIADKSHLQPVIKDIRDRFLRDIDITTEHFMFFELPLRELGGLKEKSGDAVRRILFKVFTDDECFSLISNNKSFYIELIASAGNDAFSFIDSLREQLESGANNTAMSEFSSMINSNLSNDIKIIYAKYFSSSNEEPNEIDITDTLKRIVEKEKQLHFKVDNGIVNGNDPDPGKQKILFVKFTYKGEEKERSFDEHKWLRLP